MNNSTPRTTVSKKQTKRQNSKQAQEGLRKAREGRAQAEESLEEFLRFERLVADLSARFLNIPPDRVDSEIEDGLRQILEFFQVDRCALLRTLPGKTSWLITHVAAQEGVPPVPQGTILPVSITPWAYDKLLRKREVLSVSRLDDLPAEANVDRQTWIEWGIRSNLNIPIIIGEPSDHIIVINSVKSERVWPEELFPRLQRLGEIFVNVLERKRMEEDLQTSEEKFRQFFKNIPDYCYIISAEGNILHINEAALKTLGYKREELIGKPLATIYAPESWSKMKALFDQWKKEGEIKNEEMIILSKNGEKRTVLLNVGTVRGEDGKIIHSTSIQTDITGWEQAQMEIEKQRQELIHVTRLGTLGQLASSIAHEINQPLTAILSNAQAAQRFLNQKEPNLGELREILKDIIDDDKRAGEVIRKMRSLIKKKEFSFEKLDINNLIRETILLLRGYVMKKNKKIRVQADPDLPLVDGDRVQLLQVLLNLITNGVDAMVERGPAAQELVIRTSKNDANSVVIAIKDSGSGLPDKDPHRVFEPFYSTKPEGLGMGLAISRAIVEEHSGTLHAENNPDNGATFFVTIPVAATKRT
jgi:PAS domain S-box-containing protein